jgi:hypothetical protein
VFDFFRVAKVHGLHSSIQRSAPHRLSVPLNIIMSFMFRGKRNGLSFTALNGDTDHHFVDDDSEDDAKSFADSKVKNHSNKKSATLIAKEQNISKKDSWRNDVSSVGSSHDLSVTASSHYTVESFHTAKSMSAKKKKKLQRKQEKQSLYTKTINKPLKSKVNRDMETNTSFAQIESSVVSGMTKDTVKKKKRFKQLFSAFKRKKKEKESPKEEPIEVKVVLHQPDELAINSKKDETIEYSENVFAMDVSSMDVDDSGFMSLETSKEWNLMSSPSLEFYSFEKDDISELLANVPSHDTGEELWTPSDQICFDRIVDQDHTTTGFQNTPNEWDNLPSKAWSIEPLSVRNLTTTHTEDNSLSLLPEITDDKDNDEKFTRSSAFDDDFGETYIHRSGSRASSAYTSSENDSDSSSSRELDFSTDSRLHQSTSSRITLGIMAQISGLVDRSTLTSNTGETTQYGTAYTYELDDTFDSQDDDEIAKALLRSIDSNDLAVIPDIEVIDGHISHVSANEDDLPFQANVSQIDIFGADTSADISSLIDSDQSLFHSHDSDIKNQSHDSSKIKQTDYGDSHYHSHVVPSDFEKHMTPVREDTKSNYWVQDFKNTAEASQPNVEWPETPIKKIPETPTNRGGVSLNKNGSTLENLETSFSSVQSSPGTHIVKPKVVSPRIRLHHDALLNRKNNEPTSSTSTTSPFFWRSHPPVRGTTDVASPATILQQPSKKLRNVPEVSKKLSLSKMVESKQTKVVPTTASQDNNGAEPNSTGSIAWKRALFESKSKMNISSSVTKAQRFISSIKQSQIFERETLNHPKTPLSNYKGKDRYASFSPKMPNAVASTPDSAATTTSNTKFQNTNDIPPFIEKKPMNDDAISGCSNSIADRISAFERISQRSKQSNWMNGSSSLKDKMPLNSYTLSKLENIGKNVSGLWQ